MDHLFLDREGVPTLVEVKRGTDTRIRREVVGQMLDYAANAVVWWPVEKIRVEFETTCAAMGEDPEKILLEHLGGEQTSVEEFWQQVKTNLQAGRIRMVFVADVIPSELARVVEFLNSQMDPAEVLALELRHYAGQGKRTLVPRIIGQTSEARARRGNQSLEVRQWDEESFLQELQVRCGDLEVAVARRLLAWAVRRSLRLRWGKGRQSGSFYPLLDYAETCFWTISVWTYGRVEVQFEMMKGSAPFSDEQLRRQLLERLRNCELAGVQLPDDCITRRPSVPLSALADEAKMLKFLEALDWYLETIKAHIHSS